MEILFALIGVAKDHPDLTGKIVTFAIAWFLVRKEMGKQFNKITTAIENLTKTMADIEMKHGDRILKVEVGQKALELKFDTLTKPKEGL